MKPGPPRRRRARPVADAPIEALLARGEDLAKGWLLAVLEDAPLEAAPEIMAGELPRVGPLLCAAVSRSLADERELERLEEGGDLEPLAARAGEVVGARSVHDTVRAVEALQAVIWSALREELSYADSDLISELAERLALVTDLVRLAAIKRSEGSAAVAETPAAAEAPPQAPEPEPRAPEPEPAPPRAPAASAEPARAPGPEDIAASEPGPTPAATAAPPPDPGALWLTAFEAEIAHALEAGTPLSLLRAELDDAERVLAVEPVGEANATFGRFAQAVRSAVRRQDILVCETDSRAWIIARETARAGAQALGSRIAHAVAEAGPWRGAPLRVSVGVAVLGEDGNASATLVEAAEEAAYAASASGIGIVRAVPSPPRQEDDGPSLAS
ncbi:MAG: diguanylate cyclase domain-containing protein [Solirubrobacteraceae bacterium]